MRQRLNIDDDTFVFGSIGSLIPRKANHHTLDALAQFSQKHPEAKWKMVLVGEGAERRALTEQARALGIESRVIFTGFQNTPFDYLATFDAFILASKSEGLPRVVLEAMLLNIPVIGSQVTGTAELIDHDSTGLLFLERCFTACTASGQYLVRCGSAGSTGCGCIPERLSYLCHRKLCQRCRSRAWRALTKRDNYV